MPYSTTTWEDHPSTATPINATNLNNIETGIGEALAGTATNATAISDHLADTTSAHAATAIGVTPAGTLTSTNVQAALEELDSDITAGGIPGTIMDAKGDLISASAADTPAILSVGSAGQYLSVDSGQTTGLIWQAVPASDVDITDSGAYYTGTEVETALQEVGADIAALQAAPAGASIGMILVLGG